MSPTDDQFRRLRTNDDCLQYLFSRRFPSPICPACGRVNRYYRHRTKQCFTCACGRHHIYPRQGTLFEQSPLPLTIWFAAVAIIAAGAQRPTFASLAREWGVAYPTAWRIVRRIEGRLSPGPRPLSAGQILMVIVDGPSPSRG